MLVFKLPFLGCSSNCIKASDKTITNISKLLLPAKGKHFCLQYFVELTLNVLFSIPGSGSRPSSRRSSMERDSKDDMMMDMSYLDNLTSGGNNVTFLKYISHSLSLTVLKVFNLLRNLKSYFNPIVFIIV